MLETATVIRAAVRAQKAYIGRTTGFLSSKASGAFSAISMRHSGDLSFKRGKDPFRERWADINGRGEIIKWHRFG
jgi:hypothetical protein